MPSKTVNFSVEAYRAMAAHKREGESFSDLALRKFRPHALMDLAGVLTDAQAAHMKEDMQQSRARSRRRRDDIDRRWVDE